MNRPSSCVGLWILTSCLSLFAAEYVTVEFEASKPRHKMLPYIYGVSGMSLEKAKELGVPALRWGGNRSSRYNWKTKADNAGSDWYFLNGKAADWYEVVKEQNDSNIASYVTIPLFPWVAKGPEATGFSVAKYGRQQQLEQYVADRGNGIKTDGNPITGNDPTDTSVPSSPEFQADGIKKMPAGKGLMRVYGLDNEPMLWSHTHRDVHPLPTGYDEVLTRGRDYALKIKQTDRTALVAGPVTWGWTDLNYSALDEGTDRYATHPDNQAHEGMPFVAWYLCEMAKASKTSCIRLLDLCDVHIYPQGQSDGQPLYGGKTSSDTMRSLRIRSIRGLWDSSYRDESWINQPVKLIPRIREWINTYNTGTGICIGEYNWGGDDDISGAIAQAEILGIFARERVDQAYFWAGMAGTQKWAMKLYRNPDGHGLGFGDTFLTCKSSDPDRVGFFAAKRKLDGATTLMLINKTTDAQVEILLKGIGDRAKVSAKLTRLEGKTPTLKSSKQTLTANSKLSLSAMSATLVELPQDL